MITVLKKVKGLFDEHKKGLLNFDFLILDNKETIQTNFTLTEKIETEKVKGKRMNIFVLNKDHYEWTEKYNLVVNGSYKMTIDKARKLYFLEENKVLTLLSEIGIKVSNKIYEESGIVGLKGMSIYGTTS